MKRDSLALSGALDTLDRRLRTESDPKDIFQVLQTMQRAGMMQAELQMHIERLRSANEVSDRNELLEEQALLALDMIMEQVGALSLRWDPFELAPIFTKKSIRGEELIRVSEMAMIPNDLLPPRALTVLSDANTETIIEKVLGGVDHYRRPVRADFFRVPKAAFTTRPAALLAFEDRFVFEAIAGLVASSLSSALPRQVIWPRGDTRDLPQSSEYAEIPIEWDSHYIVKADIANFYESVNHSTLATNMELHLQSPRNLTQGLEYLLNSVMGAPVGIPQGPPGSDVLASNYLLPVDLFLVEQEWQYLRFADDYFFGADTFGQARDKLSLLESGLREFGLQLNVEKTRIMRRDTYAAGLRGPSRRITSLKRQLENEAVDALRSSEDSKELSEMLEELGVDEELLWDLLYHHTTTVEEVIDSVRDRLSPDIIEVYAHFLRRLSSRLLNNDPPDDMALTEREAREAFAFIAAGNRTLERRVVSTILRWFPIVAPTISIHLLDLSERETDYVTGFLKTELEQGGHTDWVTGWLCSVFEHAPLLVDTEVHNLLSSLLQSNQSGGLTRLSCLRALARAGRLGTRSWNWLWNDASPAIRSEMFFSVLADESAYPFGRKQLRALNDGLNDV